jgi:hypothetical protein
MIFSTFIIMSLGVLGVQGVQGSDLTIENTTHNVPVTHSVNSEPPKDHSVIIIASIGGVIIFSVFALVGFLLWDRSNWKNHALKETVHMRNEVIKNDVDDVRWKKVFLDLTPVNPPEVSNASFVYSEFSSKNTRGLRPDLGNSWHELMAGNSATGRVPRFEGQPKSNASFVFSEFSSDKNPRGADDPD